MTTQTILLAATLGDHSGMSAQSLAALFTLPLVEVETDLQTLCRRGYVSKGVAGWELTAAGKVLVRPY